MPAKSKSAALKNLSLRLYCSPRRWRFAARPTLISTGGGFALSGNLSNAVIFYPENAGGYELKKGDTVTLNFKTDEPIAIEFGYILDKSAHELATLADENFSAGMEIPENGTYCFYIINASSAVKEFTDGKITIN